MSIYFQALMQHCFKKDVVHYCAVRLHIHKCKLRLQHAEICTCVKKNPEMLSNDLADEV